MLWVAVDRGGAGSGVPRKQLAALGVLVSPCACEGSDQASGWWERGQKSCPSSCPEAR